MGLSSAGASVPVTVDDVEYAARLELLDETPPHDAARVWQPARTKSGAWLEGVRVSK